MLSWPISSHHKLFWVNSVKSHQSLLPPIVNKSGDTVSDDSARADLFNQNFFLILQRKTAPIWMTCKTHYKYYTICYWFCSFFPWRCLPRLCLLDPKKACGPDQLPPYLPKKAAEFISSPLAKLFNQSMSTGQQMLFLCSKKLPSNYQLISLTLSIVVKIMEKNYPL